MKTVGYILSLGLFFGIAACEGGQTSVRQYSTTEALSARIAQYNTLKTNKAFAGSDSGFSSTAYGQPSEEKAVAVAMQECQKLNAAQESTSPCRVLYVNDKAVSQ